MHKKELVLFGREMAYTRTFQYVQEAEKRLKCKGTPRAQKLICSAHQALEQSLHASSRPRRSSLLFAARMAAGLSLRELTRGEEVPCAA